MAKKMIAEALGTAILVLFGCGAAVIAGASIGYTGISLASVWALWLRPMVWAQFRERI
ncbi:MAG: hypothetical protein FD162_3402 [Rhodobacteraceae bacterium]|nr:MAG: hypothetical protein FD162_3402 [Paracoccaceae bacterium]